MKYFTADPTLDLDASKPSENHALTLAYRTFGSPQSPAVLIPSCFSGKIETTLSFLYEGSDSVLKDYFVIVCGLSWRRRLVLALQRPAGNARPKLPQDILRG